MLEHLKGEALLSYLESAESEAKEYRAQTDDEKEECERMYNGDHWKSGSQNKSVKNLCFRAVEQELPVMLDSMPSTDVIAEGDDENEQKKEDAKALESAIKYSYENGGFDVALLSAARSALKSGEGYVYVDWDQDAEFGAGCIKYTSINWRRIFIEPMASCPDDAEILFIKTPMRVRNVQRMFPSANLDEITSENANDLSSISSDNSFGALENRWTGPSNSRSGADRYSGNGIVVLDEIWMKDYSLEDIEAEDTQEEILKERDEVLSGINPDVTEFEDHEAHIASHESLAKEIASQILGVSQDQVTDEAIESIMANDQEAGVILEILMDHITTHENVRNERTDGKKPIYPNSLRLVIKLGKTVLYDGKPPVDDGLIPLVPVYCYKDCDSPYATGEIKNIIKAQKSYNEMDQAELKALLLCSNPGWIMEEGACDPATLTNDIGLVAIHKAGKSLQRMQPGQVSPQLAQRKQADLDMIGMITGMGEAFNGEAPKDIRAGYAIERLAQQSQSRIRLKTRMLELYTIVKIAKLTASRIVKYWSQERILRLYDNSGKMNTISYDPERIASLNYEIKVLPGSSAGIDKAGMYQLMAEQVNSGRMSPQTFFKSVDVPNKSMILADLEQTDAVNQNAQAIADENEILKKEIAQLQMQLTGTALPQQAQSNGNINGNGTENGV